MGAHIKGDGELNKGSKKEVVTQPDPYILQKEGWFTFRK